MKITGFIDVPHRVCSLIGFCGDKSANLLIDNERALKIWFLKF